MKKYLSFLSALLVLLLTDRANAKVNAQDSIVFDLAQAIYLNDYASIPVYILSDDTLNALDFSVKFDEGSLTYDSTFNLTSYLSALAFFNNTDRTYRFTSSSIQPIENNKTLVLVRFIMLAGKTKITPMDLGSIKGYMNGDPCSIKITDITVGITNVSNTTNILLYPNPATEVVTIQSPQQAQATLLDVSGRPVMQTITVQAGQPQQIETALLSDGMYILKLYNDSFVTTKQIVIHK